METIDINREIEKTASNLAAAELKRLSEQFNAILPESVKYMTIQLKSEDGTSHCIRLRYIFSDTIISKQIANELKFFYAKRIIDKLIKL